MTIPIHSEMTAELLYIMPSITNQLQLPCAEEGSLQRTILSQFCSYFIASLNKNCWGKVGKLSTSWLSSASPSMEITEYFHTHPSACCSSVFSKQPSLQTSGHGEKSRQHQKAMVCPATALCCQTHRVTQRAAQPKDDLECLCWCYCAFNRVSLIQLHFY